MAASRTDLETGFDADATELAGMVRRGEVSALELVDAAIARIEAANPRLNAVIHTQFERARAEATGPLPEGPFRGVPFLLKDYSALDAGEPYHAGMEAARRAGWRATVSDPQTNCFRAAGLVVIGRTNTPELALVGTTEPASYGPTGNPWNPGRSPGGSSGGSGAAVAAGMVPAAHATDIAGSIRIPAAHCGLVGLKPTSGRFIGDHGAPIGFNAEGVVSRTVRDTAHLLDALSRSGPVLGPALRSPLRRLRVGLNRRAFNGALVDPGCADAAGLAARLLDSLGHHVEEAVPEALFADDLFPLATRVLATYAAAELDDWMVKLGRPLGEADVEPTTWRIVSAGRQTSGPSLLAAQSRLAEIRRAALSWWSADGKSEGGYDLLITPTVAAPAGPLGEYLRVYQAGRGSAFTRPFNVTGQPAVSLPLGWPDDGLPRGAQLVAAPGRDELLVQVAAELEAASPWQQRRPNISSTGVRRRR